MKRDRLAGGQLLRARAPAEDRARGRAWAPAAALTGVLGLAFITAFGAPARTAAWRGFSSGWRARLAHGVALLQPRAHHRAAFEQWRLEAPRRVQARAGAHGGLAGLFERLAGGEDTPPGLALVVALYPLVVCLQKWLAPHLKDWPLLARSAVFPLIPSRSFCSRL